MYWNRKNTSPLYVIIKKNGSAVTLMMLCASSHERCPLPGRKVKKSTKIFLCVMTPVTTAMSISMVHTPTRRIATSYGT